MLIADCQLLRVHMIVPATVKTFACWVQICPAQINPLNTPHLSFPQLTTRLLQKFSTTWHQKSTLRTSTLNYSHTLPATFLKDLPTTASCKHITGYTFDSHGPEDLDSQTTIEKLPRRRQTLRYQRNKKSSVNRVHIYQVYLGPNAAGRDEKKKNGLYKRLL
jgi:hypothetical protein